MNPFRHILFATDLSEASTRARDVAAKLAVSSGAQLTVVHAVEIPLYAYPGAPMTAIDLTPAILDAATDALDDTVQALKKDVPNVNSCLQTGVPADIVLRVARDVGADLLVLGTHGRRHLARALLGSVAEKLVRLSPIPVLTVHGDAPPAHDDASKPNVAAEAKASTLAAASKTTH